VVLAHRSASRLGAFPALERSLTRKGALVARWPGESESAPRAVTAHVDTLGAMVKEIKDNGRLKLTRIGGVVWNTVEGEGLTVFTRKHGPVRGSLLLAKASTHVYGSKVNDEKRDDNAMEVRLDARTTSPGDASSFSARYRMRSTSTGRARGFCLRRRRQSFSKSSPSPHGSVRPSSLLAPVNTKVALKTNVSQRLRLSSCPCFSFCISGPNGLVWSRWGF